MKFEEGGRSDDQDVHSRRILRVALGHVTAIAACAPLPPRERTHPSAALARVFSKRHISTPSMSTTPISQYPSRANARRLAVLVGRVYATATRTSARARARSVIDRISRLPRPG